MDQYYFDEKIKNIIKMYEYPVWIIHPDEKINCVCQDFSTKQGDPNCMKCLGIGKKIYIKKIKAAVQPCVIANAEYHEKEGRIYYSRDIYPVQKYDIIVDHTHVDVVQNVKRFQSDHCAPVYYQISTAPKGLYRELFRLNFYQIVGDSDA